MNILTFYNAFYKCFKFKYVDDFISLLCLLFSLMILINVAVIKHLPATIGIYIGIIFGLPAFWVLQLGELFALLFYSYICYKALQIMPIKKNMMAWFMIFPMALQQAASINYDAVLIPLCYLFISYMLYLKYEKTYIDYNFNFYFAIRENTYQSWIL